MLAHRRLTSVLWISGCSDEDSESQIENGPVATDTVLESENSPDSTALDTVESFEGSDTAKKSTFSDTLTIEDGDLKPATDTLAIEDMETETISSTADSVTEESTSETDAGFTRCEDITSEAECMAAAESSELNCFPDRATTIDEEKGCIEKGPTVFVYCRDLNKSCDDGEDVTYVRDPETGECYGFSNLCVPEGWTEDSECNSSLRFCAE